MAKTYFRFPAMTDEMKLIARFHDLACDLYDDESYGDLHDAIVRSFRQADKDVYDLLGCVEEEVDEQLSSGARVEWRRSQNRYDEWGLWGDLYRNRSSKSVGYIGVFVNYYSSPLHIGLWVAPRRGGRAGREELCRLLGPRYRVEIPNPKKRRWVGWDQDCVVFFLEELQGKTRSDVCARAGRRSAGFLKASLPAMDQIARRS